MSLIQPGLKVPDGPFVLLADKLVHISFLGKLLDLKIKLVDLSPIPKKSFVMKYRGLQKGKKRKREKYQKLSQSSKEHNDALPNSALAALC